MKKSLFLSILMLLPMLASTAMGQNGDNSMFAEGRNWRYEYLKPDGQSIDGKNEGYIKYDFAFKVGNDVLFDGHQCKEIFTEGMDGMDGIDGTSPYAYGYEEGGRVMLYAQNNIPAFYAPFPTGQWVTLYDFNVQKDSHCQMGAFSCSDMIVSEMGLIDDVYHRSHRYIGLSDARNSAWPKRYAIEGIGSPFGLFEFDNLITNGAGSRFVGCYDGDVCIFTADDFNVLTNPNPADNMAYRPFIEEGKVWKVGNTQTILDNSAQVVDYYYFDGDTIVGGKTCKQMMCQRYVNPNYTNEYWTPKPFLRKVGAWYEENQKVYYYDEGKQTMMLKYDFSLAANDTLQFLTDWSSPFIIGPKQTGGLEGFKGIYRDIRMCGDEGRSYHDTFWLEGVGCLRGPISNPCDPILGDPLPEFLMSCTVGDEVIYLNDKVEDGATPEGARKGRFDFTHTVKTKPKAPRRSVNAQSLYGEYNAMRLDINLDPLDDAYLVRITDESGKVVYEKSVNAGTVVALSIDISAYAKGRYTVTIENSDESFTGQFEAQTSGIETIVNNLGEKDHHIYNLQGQRISSLQRGLNIMGGKKIVVK